MLSATANPRAFTRSRIRKACGRARQVVVVNYGGRAADLWWDKHASALARLDKAVAADPRNAEAYAQKAVTLRLAGKYEQSLEQYDKAAELSPDNAIYINGRGIALERLGRLDELERASIWLNWTDFFETAL